ncbi:hypothetical protein J4E91_007927 [Alternaria rosae]|nr:hypothetical protein J4E91_007927 [Alternaria rosae]
MDCPSYHCESLAAPDHIRLITIVPGERGSAIKLGIERADINSHPKYECLSYAWGTDGPDRSITINDSSLFVTATLYVALEHLRDASQERKIWIDAICINQKDITERNSQVAIMRKIYRNATRVIVWIGPATESSEQAMEFLEMLATARKHRKWYTIDWSKFDQKNKEPNPDPPNPDPPKPDPPKPDPPKPDPPKPDPSIPDPRLQPWRERLKERSDGYMEAVKTAEATKHDFAVTGYPVLYNMDGNPYDKYFKHEWEPYWEALDELLTRPWWERTWIVQEIWCASDAVLQCGSTIIEWKTFQMAMDYSEAWDDIGDALKGMKRESQWDTLRRRYTLAINLAKARVNGSSLSSLLWNTWDRASTDPKDKVFVVLGLVGDAQGNSVEPDYRKSMDQVYRETAHHIISKEGRLDILLAASGIQSNDGLPSWVPDWRREAYAKKPILLVNRHLLMKLCYSGSTDMVVLQGHGYRAAGNSEPYSSFSQDFRVMTVLGIQLDSIAEVWGVDVAAMRDGEFISRAFDFILQSKFVSSEARQIVSAEREKLATSRHGSIVMTTLTGGCNVRYDRRAPTMRNIMRQRRLFVTKQGYIGIGPVEARSHDTVFIISGCNFPIILRPRKNMFAVVGEAYMHGFMAGEALALAPARPWKKISIL